MTLVSSFLATKVCAKYDRKTTILIASSFLLLEAELSAAAEFIWMLILGRIALGIGVGFGNEVLVSHFIQI